MHGVHAGVAVAGADERVAEVQLVLGPGDGDVEQPPFLFLPVFTVHCARGREHAVAQHDHEDDFEFESLGLMNGGELDFFVLGLGRLFVLRLHVGKQGQLGEKFLHGTELEGEDGQLFHVLNARGIVGVVLLEIIIVAGINEQAQHFGRAFAGLGVLQLRDGGDELGPADGRLLAHVRRAGFQGVGDGLDLGQLAGHLGGENVPELVRALGGDAGQQLGNAFEGDLVARIDDELQVGGGVLDVRLLKEPDAAGDGEGDLALGELELQFQRMKVRSIQHGDLAHAHAFVVQFQHALRDEGGLLRGVHARDQGRFHAGLARGRQFLGKLIAVGGDGGVGDLEDLGRAAVIGLDLEHPGPGITIRELQDVQEIRPAPGVDALRVVAHHHDVLVARGEQVDEVALQLVGVLIFVHEDELKAALVMFAHVGMVLQQLQPQRQQVVEVHAVGGALAGNVTLLQVGDLFGELLEVAELRGHDFFGGPVGVDGERKDFVEHLGLGKMRAFDFDAGVGHAGLDEILGVVAVQNGEVAMITEQIGVRAQHAAADGVEGATPQPERLLADEVGNAPHHFRGRLVGKGEQEDLVRRNALFEQVGDAIGERAGLAGAGTGDDQGRAGQSGDRRELLRIEFARIVNVQPDLRRERFQDIIERHERKLNGQTGVDERKITPGHRIVP